MQQPPTAWMEETRQSLGEPMTIGRLLKDILRFRLRAVSMGCRPELHWPKVPGSLYSTELLTLVIIET